MHIRIIIIITTTLFLSACAVRSGNTEFERYLGRIVEDADVTLSQFYYEFHFTPPIQARKYLIEEKVDNQKGMKRAYFKVPGSLRNSTEPYRSMYCYYHVDVDMRTDMIIGWGYDIPDDKARRRICVLQVG